MDMKERCSICGYVMKKDPVSGRSSCLWCGNDFGITDESIEGTYEEARALVRDGGFDRAIKILNGLDKGKTEVLLLNLLCCYRASDAAVLVDKASSCSSSVKTLVEREDVKQLKNKLRIRKNDLIKHVMEYCLCGLALSGADMKAIQAKLKSLNTPANEPKSAFTKMDDEERYNDERVRTIREAAKPKKMDPREFEDKVDLNTGNVLLDVFNFLTTETELHYPRTLTDFLRFIAQNREPKAPDRSDVFEGTGNDDFSAMLEDVKARQVELKKLILEEEKAVLD